MSSNNREPLYNIAWRNRETGAEGKNTGCYTLEQARQAIDRLYARSATSGGPMIEYWPVEVMAHD